MSEKLKKGAESVLRVVVDEIKTSIHIEEISRLEFDVLDTDLFLQCG